MKKVIALTAVLALSSFAYAEEKSKGAPTEAEIKQFAATLDQAWNKGDFKALGDCYDKDAVVRMPSGQAVEGRDAIVKKAQAGDPKARPTRKTTIDKVRFVGSDLALVDTVTELSAANRPQPIELRMVALNVKKDGKWRILELRPYPVRSQRAPSTP